MFRQHSRESARSVPLFALYDLRAKLAPLDRYGPNGLSSALVDGLRALLGAWKTAFCPAAS
jgi:hypothetical protein